jgi:hypothetical protein
MQLIEKYRVQIPKIAEVYMTINDIKIEALKLMFTNYNEDISDINDCLNDDNYSAYIPAMNGAINRAVGRLWAKRVITKMFTLLPTAHKDTANYSDLCDVLYPVTDTERLLIEERIKSQNPDSEGVDLANKVKVEINNEIVARRLYIPADAQALIPYYIKAELYEEDEPSLAMQARNFFEQGIEDRQGEEVQECIENVFRSGWLG